MQPGPSRRRSDTLIMPLRKGYEFPKVTERTLVFRERFGLRLSCLADTQGLADTQEPIHESEDEQCNTGEPESDTPGRDATGLVAVLYFNSCLPTCTDTLRFLRTLHHLATKARYRAF